VAVLDFVWVAVVWNFVLVVVFVVLDIKENLKSTRKNILLLLLVPSKMIPNQNGTMIPLPFLTMEPIPI